MASFRRFLRTLRIRRFSYTPLIEIRIYKEAVLHNLKVFQEYSGLTVAPVLKSNAYGHGLIPVAKILDTQNLPFLCVDSFFEALILRNEGIRSPLLIIGYTPLHTILHNNLKNISFSIMSLDELEQIADSLTSPTRFHLKVDTGMHRQGVLPNQINTVIETITKNPNIHLEGVYSHLADADTPESPHTKKQIESWNAMAYTLKEVFPTIRYLHCAASAGSSYSTLIHANTMRLGIGLYGIPLDLPLDLQPALSMHTKIASIRNISPGDSVGYNATFTTTTPMRLASVPAGYSEGVDRRLSNKGVFLLQQKQCPIVGRVSMNITSIDISGVSLATLGDEVTVISNDPKAQNSIATIAKTCGTIPYEILVHIPRHLRRVVY